MELAERLPWWNPKRHLLSEQHSETLESDRDDAFVMLDHFFRRVVGGLIPVADLSDICRAINVFRAYEGSKVVRRTVVVPGQPKGES